MSSSLYFRNNRNRSLAVNQLPTETQQTETLQKKPDLHVVPKLKSKKVSLILPCFFILATALLGVLVLKIQITQKQYQIVQLRNEVRGVQREAQALAEKVGTLSAPGNLVKQADSLGMVPSNSHLFIDLATGKINGEVILPQNPAPAEKPVAQTPVTEIEANPTQEANSEEIVKENLPAKNYDSIPAPIQTN